MPPTTAGYIYTVTGDPRFLDEALESVRSLRHHQPGAHATLVTDLGVDDTRPETHDLFDSVVRPEEKHSQGDGSRSAWKKNLLFKIRHIYESSPYRHTFFVDTDTRFLRSCADLFNLLEHFDLCISHAPNDLETVPGHGEDLASYTPYNTGVMLFRKNPHTEAFFRQWHRIYSDRFDEYKYGQPAFMAALLECDHRIHSYVLQSTMNFRNPYNERLLGPVRILHGRPADPDRVAAEVNRTHENRVWLADLGVVVPLRLSLGEQFRLLRKLGVEFVFSCRDALWRTMSRAD